MRRRFLVALSFAAIGSPPMARAFWFGPTDWPSVKRQIRDRYPEVRHISTQALNAALMRGDAPLLIDARTSAEYQVSHLQGAHHAETFAQATKVLAQMPATQAIVVYCSVGYRSAALARALVRAGYTQTVNLEGSIFEWANNGLPVYRGTTLVHAVHPYDARWGALLDRKRWSTEQP